DLIEKGAIRRNPVIARSAADVSAKPPEGAITLDIWTRRILCDFDLGAVDMEGADVAVAENRSVQHSVIGGDSQPAKLSDRASPGINRYNLADANSAIFVDLAQGHSIADGVSDYECIRPVVQELDVEGRSTSSILEGAFAERAVGIDAVDYYAVRIRE